MSKSLNPYVNMEVERLTNNVVNKAIRKKLSQEQYGKFLSDTGKSFSLDIVKLNQVKDDLANYVSEILTHLEDASISDYYLAEYLKTGKFKRIKQGVLAENSIFSLSGSTLFGNIGPSIPIRLFFVGQVYPDIDIQTKEYGVNNIIVEIYLVLTVKEQVMMPLTSKKQNIVVREILEVDIVRGDIPENYINFSK